MAEVKWIKLFVDIWDNRKIKQLESLPSGDAVLVIWLKLLTLAGMVNDGGLVYVTHDIPYTDEMLATQFNRPLEVIKMALNVFERFGMIERFDDVLMVTNWEKYQSLEKMEVIRMQTRKRVAEYRERKKIGNVTCNADVTLCNATDIEEDKEEDKRINNNMVDKAQRFVPPTRDEITSYCTEKGIAIDVDRFIDYYTSNGWKVGRNKMKDWKATVRNWARGNKAETTEKTYSIVGSDEKWI